MRRRPRPLFILSSMVSGQTAAARRRLRVLHRDPVWHAAWKEAVRAGQFGARLVTLGDLLDRYVEPEPNSGCWVWVGCRNKGYGVTPPSFCRHSSVAHRVVYEASGHLLLPGFELHHKCRLRCCVNPGHLMPLTASEHTRRTFGWYSDEELRAPAPVPVELDDETRQALDEWDAITR